MDRWHPKLAKTLGKRKDFLACVSKLDIENYRQTVEETFNAFSCFSPVY